MGSKNPLILCQRYVYVHQAFLGHVFGKPRFWLCQNLEFLSWLLSFFLGFFSWVVWKATFSPFKNWLSIQYFNWKLGILATFQSLQCIFPFVLVNICSYFPKLCRNLEFSCPWGFFSNGPKKACYTRPNRRIVKKLASALHVFQNAWGATRKNSHNIWHE